jgi:hypothetical protein
MRLRKIYIQEGNNKNRNMASELLKGSSFLTFGVFCMLSALFLSKPSSAQTVSRTSTVLAGASPFQDSLWTLTTPTYEVLKRLSPSLSGFTVTGINGIATDPISGTHYCILKVSGVSGRVLATINIQTGVCAEVGNLGDNFASLAFNANGTLFGVTGDGATVPETMYRINKIDATKTLFRALGAGADGEVILFNPDDNMFYHWSGNGTVVWERFDTTGIDVIEGLTYTGTAGGETFGAYYLGGNDILVSDISSNFRIWSVTGATGSIGSTIATMPDDLRGLVSETHASSISAGGSTWICSGGSVALTVSGGTGGYQWYINGSSIGGANSGTYVATAAGIYNCVYADINGIIDSPTTGITVSLLTNPSISLGAHPQVCLGASSTAISYTTNTNYSFTGSSNTYYVPSGVTSVNFDLMGGVGGNDTSMTSNPGKGGRVQGTLAVTPGDVITVNAGGAGAMGTITGAMGGFNGGGNSFGFGGSGGGASDIRLNGTSLSDRVAIAGGGGGSGYDGVAFSVAGGNGGDVIGGDAEFNADGSKAIGGDASAGGAGAVFVGYMPGSAGAFGMGGDASTDGVSGAGGGGLYGGGGGVWSGGAGGSSYTDAILVSSAVHTQGANSGAGSVNISFAIPSAYTYSIVWDLAATTAGFTDVSSTPFPTSSFPIDIPSTAGPDTYNGTLIMSDGSCTYSEPISVTVKPIPDVNPTADQTLCNGVATTTVNFTGSLSGTTFDWTNDLSTVGIAATGTGDIMSFTATNATSANQVAEIVVTPVLNGCYGPADTFTYTVKPTPTLTSPTNGGFICDNTTFNYTATTAVSGATFEWFRDVMTGDVAAAVASGTTNVISETFDNTGDNPVAVAYTFTVTASGCESIENVTTTVNPTPTLLPELIGTVCSGGTVTFTQASATLGLVHSWSRDTVTGIAPGATSGTGYVNEMLTNLTPNPITVVYIDTLNINGCINTESLSVVVNPMPVLTSALTHNICDNATFNYTATTATAGTTITWERFPVSGVSSAYATGPDTVSEMHDNTTDNPVTVTYNFSLTANSCTNMQNVTVVVNPTPALNTTLAPAAICDSTFFDYIPSSNTTGAAFTWARAAVANITNPAASGTGNPHERLRNASNLPVAVTYVFTSTLNGCSGTDNVVVTVKPKPKLSNSPSSFSICDSAVFTFAPASTTTGTTFDWARGFVSGIGQTPASGTGNINELLTNNTNTDINVGYVITLTADGCTNTQVVPVVVHPTPLLSSTLSDSACSGSPYTYKPLPLTIPALTYKWSRASVSNISPTFGSGVDNINETLINATANTLNVTYVYTLTVGGTCTNTQNLLVKVRPSAEIPVIGVMPPSSLCNGTMFQNFGASVPAPTGVSYTWSADNAEVYATGTGNQYSLVNFTTPGTAVVKLSSTIGATGCIGVASYTVNVGSTTVSMPSVIYTHGKFICLQSNVKTYQWGYDDAITLDSVLLKGEINQSYFNAAPETTARNYWVMTTAGDCTEKAYYNKPNDNTPKAIYDGNDGIAEIRVFPNPTSENINVEVLSSIQGNVEVELVNMLGQVISKATTSSNKTSINVASLPGGFYMIDCYQEGVKVGTAKFVKN